MEAILDSLIDPILFVDTGHKICYMNKAAISHFEEGENLLGRSLLDCHNDQSIQLIIETLEILKGGEVERLITDGDEQRIYMRAVRGEDGALIGYYERYEPVGKSDGSV
jgi:PAS domain-containing protein